MRAARAWTALAQAGCLCIPVSRFVDAQETSAPPATDSATTEPAAPALPTSDFTTQRRFQLPINLGPSPAGIAAVQLYASVDRGETWQLYAEQPSHAQAFRVQAGQDGEYWFAVKTVDHSRSIRPAGPTRVDRIVVVDNRKPQIRLDAETLENGDVRIKWQATDPFLDPATFSIQYQAGAGSAWQALEVEPHNRVQTESSIGGEHVWTPQVRSRLVNVRVAVRDRAKNEAVENRRIFLTRLLAQPASDVATTKVSTGTPPVTDRAPPPAQPATNTASDSRPVKSTLPPAPPLRSGVPWPIDNQLPSAPDTLTTDASPTPPRELPATEGNTGYGRFASDVRPSVGDQVPGNTSDAPEQPAPTEDEVSSSSDPALDADRAYRWPEIPPGEPLRMTQSRRFHLEYDIESLGPGAVSEVQLWGTQDGGRTWEKWNIDADLKSPFDVQVNEEGIYGFRVVIIAANGLAGEVPSPGSPADLWVGYDATRPTAEITAVLYGAGVHLGKLDIQWTAADRRMGERPITLSFAPEAEGPWTTIATSLPNSGQYYWELGSSVPKQLYLRLECADEAGNSVEYVTAEPVNTAGVFPRARIKAVQPVAPANGT